MADRATERLDRILYILPLAVRSGGVTLDELSAALGCPPSGILADLEEVTARAFYHAAGAADQLQILVDGNRVQVFAGREFTQPVRLSPREAMALELGLRILAAERTSGERARVIELADRLRHELAVEAADSPVLDTPGVELDIGEDGFRGAIAQAAIDRHRCRITYLRPGDDEPAMRDIAPYMLVHSSGSWYVLGHDADRDDIRIYRMDRVLGVVVTDTAFDVPGDFDASSFVGPAGVYRSAEGEVEVTVRYSRNIARWIAERMPVEPLADGAVIARHRVADPGWIVRHVLRYGEDARVIEPASVRERVALAALRLTA